MGHTVTYEVTGEANKIGLFPRLTEARVQNINLNAAVTPKDTLLFGALACHAQKSVVTGVNASVTYPSGAAVSGAGLVAYVDAESVLRDCSVEVAAGPASLPFRNYGGIALENEGTLSGCTFTLRGVAATLAEFGGIARLNYGGGTIADAKAVLAGTGEARVTIAGDNVGGTVSLLAGGTLSGVSVYCDLPENTVCGNYNNTGGVVANINPSLAKKATAPVLLENCVAEGPVLAGERRIGGIVGNSDVSQTESVTLNACVSKIQTVKSYYTLETDARPSDADGAGSNARVGGVFGSCEVRNRTLLNECVSYSNIYGQHVLGGILACVAYGETRGAEPNTFTMTNSHCYAEEIVANADGYGCGGIMSHLFLAAARDAALLNHQTTITGCTSYANILAYKQYCGGAIGYYDVQTENPKADMKYHFQNVHVYGNVTVKPAAGAQYSGFGGFFGSVTAANLRVADCSANGSVDGLNDEGTNAIYRAGGFIGTQYNVAGIDGVAIVERCYATGNVTARHNAAGFAADCRGMTFKDCKATGNIIGGTDSGGFAGCSRSNYMENCVATGNVTAIGIGASIQIGGFTGTIPQGGTYLNCFAYGDVVSSGTSYGGFAGVIHATAAEEKLTMTNCGAYGSVSHTAALTGGDGGGFVGLINGIVGSVKLDKCFANGPVKGFRVAGFFGLMNVCNSNDVTFTDCVARGDVNARQNQGVAGYEIGGFFGAFANVKGATRFTRCESYGSVWNATGNDASYDTGGFGGWLTADTENVTLDACNSYAKELSGTHTDATYWSVGGLLGGTGTTKVTITNCKYTAPGGEGMVGKWGASYTAPATATGNAVTAAAANTRPQLTCAITASGANVSIAFTNLANISGYVTDFAVSLDGGRTYTVLIYTSRDNAVKGMMLTQIAGATNALGQFAAQNFTYVLKNLGAYPAGNISVRIAFSDGFSATYQK